MSATKLICPACQAVLRAASELPSSKRIKCSACGEIFTVAEGARAAHARSRARLDDDVEVVDDDVAPRGVRRRPTPVRNSSSYVPLVIALSVVGGLFVIFAVAGGIIWLVFAKKDKSSEQDAALQMQQQFSVQTRTSSGSLGGSGPKVGSAAPEIEGEDLDGNRFKLSDYRGKVVLLDFWGDW